MARRPTLTVEKALLIALVMGLFLGGYYGVGHLTLSRARPLPLVFAFERQLPLVPFMVFPYMLALVLPDFALFCWPDDDHRGLRRQALCYGVMQCIGFAIFLIYPVQADLRPPSLSGDGTSLRVLAHYYRLDPPVNLFPSLHCANAVLAALMAHKLSRRVGWIISALAGLVVISVPLVKQHYIADALAGIALAFVIDRLMGPPPPPR
jgi:hypothetical protein